MVREEVDLTALIAEEDHQDYTLPPSFVLPFSVGIPVQILDPDLLASLGVVVWAPASTLAPPFHLHRGGEALLKC